MRDVRVHAITGEFSHNTAAEFETWDHTFRRGIVARGVDLTRRKAAIDTAGIDCADAVRRVRALGANGRIEALARAIVNAAPDGAEPVLAKLVTEFETRFDIPVEARSFEFRLYWQRGVICASADHPFEFHVASNSVGIYDQSLPEQVVIRLPGTPLHTVFDHPFRCDTPIRSVEENHGRLSIEVEPDLWLVNCREGRMWREPQAFDLSGISDF